jgi:hypothetical protein
MPGCGQPTWAKCLSTGHGWFARSPIFLWSPTWCSCRTRRWKPGGFIEVEGAADLVVEILSDSSVGKDTRRLPEAYAKAGVGELWLVDARRCGAGDEQPEFRLLTL